MEDEGMLVGVPFIRTALKQMTDGDLPYPITTHMLFHMLI